VAPPGLSPSVDEEVVIASRGFDLVGRLTLPERMRGLVVFAHVAGNGGRNLSDGYVAGRLSEFGFGTLLIDLFASDELPSHVPTFDLDVLAVRLMVATRWLRARPGAATRSVAYFGVRTGAAVAMLAAAEDHSISAVVVRTGRLDLVAPALASVRAPTLLVTGGADIGSGPVNERAMAALTCTRQLAVVPGASERFVEPGALDTTARLAGAWFLRHLGTPSG
jgi:putative phosphoribosyl transferase